MNFFKTESILNFDFLNTFLYTQLRLLSLILMLNVISNIICTRIKMYIGNSIG